MEVSGQPYTLAVLCLGKSSQYPLNERLGGLRAIMDILGMIQIPCHCQDLIPGSSIP